MDEQVRMDYQKYLLNRYGIKLCKQIYDDEIDISHDFYQTVFKDFDWKETK